MNQRIAVKNEFAERQAFAADPPYLILSGQDFRSKRKVSVHFVAEELARLGRTRFFSLGYSFLSLIKKDPRQNLWNKANKIETCDGVEAYLWKTFLHPVNLRRKNLQSVADAFFRFYAHRAPPVLLKWIKEAETIFLESGMAVLFFDLIKKLNPRATVLYICSDALGTIGCAKFLQDELADKSILFDGIQVPSKLLASEFSNIENIYYVPHAVDYNLSEDSLTSPYEEGSHLVSLGSMLFDPAFFELAAVQFPQVTFHIIGAGRIAAPLAAPNIIIHDEMPFDQTLRYLMFANAGVAAYRGREVAPYLADTSMKLMQFESLGLPAVCPQIVVGEHVGRFGYIPGDAASIAKAINGALAYGHFSIQPHLNWREVTQRILHPGQYPDTFL